MPIEPRTHPWETDGAEAAAAAPSEAASGTTRPERDWGIFSVGRKFIRPKDGGERAEGGGGGSGPDALPAMKAKVRLRPL